MVTYSKTLVCLEGGFQGFVQGPANFGVSPLRNQVINIDVHSATFSYPFKILAKDDLNVAFQIHLVIRFKPGTFQVVVGSYSGMGSTTAM